MAAMIKGKTIILYEVVEVGVDDFNRPIYQEVPTEVENVLIQPASSDAIVSESEVYGKYIAYVLHIPKSDTHNWDDATVEFYGKKWKTYGEPIVYDEGLTPLDWNKQIKVERYE